MAGTVTVRIAMVISGMFVGGGRWTLVCSCCAACNGVLLAAVGFRGEPSSMGFPAEIDCGKGEDYGNQGEGKKLSIKIFDKHQPSINCAGFLLGLDYKSIRLFVSNGLCCRGIFYCLVR